VAIHGRACRTRPCPCSVGKKTKKDEKESKNKEKNKKTAVTENSIKQKRRP